MWCFPICFSYFFELFSHNTGKMSECPKLWCWQNWATLMLLWPKPCETEMSMWFREKGRDFLRFQDSGGDFEAVVSNQPLAWGLLKWSWWKMCNTKSKMPRCQRLWLNSLPNISSKRLQKINFSTSRRSVFCRKQVWRGKMLHDRIATNHCCFWVCVPPSKKHCANNGKKSVKNNLLSFSDFFGEKSKGNMWENSPCCFQSVVFAGLNSYQKSP